MSELKKRPSGNGDGVSPEEDEVRRLLERAGHRPEVPEADLETIKTAFRAQWEAHVGRRQVERPKIERRRYPAWRLLPLAAGVLLALGAGWWWWRSGPRPAVAVAEVRAVEGNVSMGRPLGDPETPATAVVVGQEIPSGAELETAGGEAGAEGRVALRLGEGLEVRIDAGSRVRLASAAVVELERGALYVDSGAGPKGGEGIEIRTAGGVARDIGTRFEVRLLAADPGAMRVRVRDGTVLVVRGDSTWPAEGGTELTLDAGGAVHRQRIAPHGPEWAWVLEAAPRFDIEGRTLSEFLDWVARETGWEIRFTDQALDASAGTIVLHGALPDLTPDQTPALVLPGAGLRHRRVEGALVISAAEGTSDR